MGLVSDLFALQMPWEGKTKSFSLYAILNYGKYGAKSVQALYINPMKNNFCKNDFKDVQTQNTYKVLGLVEDSLSNAEK